MCIRVYVYMHICICVFEEGTPQCDKRIRVCGIFRACIFWICTNNVKDGVSGEVLKTKGDTGFSRVYAYNGLFTGKKRPTYILKGSKISQGVTYPKRRTVKDKKARFPNLLVKQARSVCCSVCCRACCSAC